MLAGKMDARENEWWALGSGRISQELFPLFDGLLHIILAFTTILTIPIL